MLRPLHGTGCILTWQAMLPCNALSLPSDLPTSPIRPCAELTSSTYTLVPTDASPNLTFVGYPYVG